jgi:hypothetical protein
MKDIEGKELTPGDIILIPLQATLCKHVYIRETKGGPVLSDNVKITPYTPNSRNKKTYNINRAWGAGRSDINTHNSVIHKQYFGDCLIVGRKEDFNALDYKTNKQLYNEFRQSQTSENK